MQALVTPHPPYHVVRATPSFSSEFAAAGGGAAPVGAPLTFMLGAESCRGTAAVLLDAITVNKYGFK